MIGGKKILSCWFYTLVLFTLLLAVTAGIPEKSRAAISEQDAHAIGIDAYLYFYSLITMDITRKQSTNIEPDKEFGKGPMNMFVNVPEYPPATLRTVVQAEFRHLVFYRMAGSHSGACDRFRTGYGWAILSVADA